MRNGGTLWADGLLAWKNEYGEIGSRIPGALGDVFGADAPEVEPVGNPYSVTAANEQAGELWQLPLELKGAQVLLRDRDGKPFAVRHSFGKGEAIYYASALTLAYRRRNNELVQRWIAQPAVAAKADAPVKLEKGADAISFRVLAAHGKTFVVLSNWGPTGAVTVRFAGDYAKVVERSFRRGDGNCSLPWSDARNRATSLRRGAGTGGQQELELRKHPAKRGEGFVHIASVMNDGDVDAPVGNQNDALLHGKIQESAASARRRRSGYRGIPSGRRGW